MRRKVTLKIFTPLLHEVESKLDDLHMKRDSFLNHLIDRELPHLENDLQGKRLPVSIRRFIARSLKRLGCSQINVQLDSPIAERLDEIALATNLVRDSFINRLLYFSIGSDALYNILKCHLPAKLPAIPVAQQAISAHCTKYKQIPFLTCEEPSRPNMEWDYMLPPCRSSLLLSNATWTTRPFGTSIVPKIMA